MLTKRLAAPQPSEGHKLMSYSSQVTAGSIEVQFLQSQVAPCMPPPSPRHSLTARVILPLSQVASFLDTYWDASLSVSPSRQEDVRRELSIAFNAFPARVDARLMAPPEYRCLKAGPSAWPEPRDFIDTPTLEEVASFLDTYWDAFSKVYPSLTRRRSPRTLYSSFNAFQARVHGTFDGR